MAATMLKPKAEQLIRWDGAAYSLTPVPRQDNQVAATGKTFDLRHAIAAYQADGVTVDTSYVGAITATVTTGTCTLGGTVTRNAVAGAADFSDLYPATGTGSLAITFSAAGLTSYVTRTMTVVAPSYDAYALTLGVSIEKPRLTVDTTYPTITNTYTVGSGKMYATVQAAIDAVVALDQNTHSRIAIDAGTYVEHVTLKAKATGMGLICLEPATGIPGTAGERVTAAQVQAAGVLIHYGTPTDPNTPTIGCQSGAHHYRISGIELGRVFGTGTEQHFDIVDLRNPNTDNVSSDTIYQSPSYIGLDRCYIHGESGKTVKHAIADDGRYIFVTNCVIDEIHATFSPDTGSGDEQAIYSVSALGPALYDNNHFRATGEITMFGGGDPYFYDVRNFDKTISRNYYETPIAWQGIYKHKNNNELKNAGRLWYWGNVFEGSWDNNQDGLGLKYASANQSYAQPYAATYSFEGISDIITERNFARTMTGFLSLVADANTGSSTPSRRVSVHHNLAVNIGAAACALSGTNAVYSMLLGGGLTNCVIGHNTVLGSTDSTAASLRMATMEGPAAGYAASTKTYLRDNIWVCRGLGVNEDAGSYGSTAITAVLPDDTFAGNLLYDRVSDGVTYPAASYYPANLAAVGLVNAAIVSSWATADPDTVAAACALAPATTYKGVATDATDPGADMTALRSAISGVWDGTATQTATKLALSVQPSGAVSGMTLGTQPSGAVQDSSNATVTTDASTVTATWTGLTGDAVETGGTTATASAGLWSFTTLGLSWSVPSTGYFTFTDGSLTSVSSTVLTLPVGAVSSVSTLPTPIDQWRPKPTREGLRVIVSPSPLIGTGGLVAVASNTVSVHIPVGRVQVSVLSLAIDAMVAAAGSGAITATVNKVTASGVVTPLTAATSLKSDVVTAAGNIALPMLTSVFGGAADGARRIDGTTGDYLRVDIIAAGTVTTQPQVRIVAELAVTK